VAEDKNNEEEKFDFTPEGEGYISLDEARILAVRTAVASPGDYGRGFRRVTMVFDVVEATETDDHYTVILSVRPQGNFDGTPGQEQFVVGKEGTIAVRQVLSTPIQTSASPADTPRKGGGFPILPVAIGVVVVGIIAALGAVFVMNSSGGDSVPIAAAIPTDTPAPTETLAPTETPASAPTFTPMPTYTPYPTPTPVPTYTPYPTPVPTYTPRPTARPTSPPTSTIQPGSAITGQNCGTATGAGQAVVSITGQRVIPHAFLGLATVNGRPAADGTVVTAWVDGQQVTAKSVTDGYYPPLIVEPRSGSFAGKTVTFAIGGTPAEETVLWKSGEVTELNLTAFC